MITDHIDEAALVVNHAADLARLVTSLQEEIDHLRQAVDRRQRIGVAVGLLASRYAVDPDAAFAVLVRLSQTLNVKLWRVAAVVVGLHCGRVDQPDQQLADRVEALLAGCGRA